MKKIILMVLFIFLVAPVFAEIAGTLDGVMKPVMIAVDGDELYVVEGCTFSAYSLKDLKFLRKFGKKGEGPGELMEIPYFPNKITILKNRLFVTGVGKALSFSKDGKFVKEFRTHQRVIQMLPAGKNFVTKEQSFKDDKKTAIIVINLYDKDMKKLKELYRQDWVKQGEIPAIKMDMSFDFTGITVSDDKIYIEESPKGFLIEVFDSNGNKLYDIKREDPKLKITAKDKERTLNMMATDPYLKSDLKSIGGWKGFKKFITMTYPDHYAPIKGIEVSGGKIVVRTHKSKGDKEEYLVLDLKGNLLKKVWISRDLEVSLIAQIAGGKLYAISNDKLYFLRENEDDEEWELHIEPLM